MAVSMKGVPFGMMKFGPAFTEGAVLPVRLDAAQPALNPMVRNIEFRPR